MSADAPERGAHLPVLCDEVVSLLEPAPGETALDCTAGLGGHAAAIAIRLGSGGTIVLNDLDPANLSQARARVESLPDPARVVAFQGSFAEAPRRMAEQGLAADVVLADLGFASVQVDEAGRGFSFSRDGPLDMRYDPAAAVSAADLVNSASEQELADLLWEYGEERAARRIAQKIVAERRVEPITTTSRLASIVRAALGRPPRATQGGRPDRIDPATRTFQALRIAVNDELGSLRSLLESVRRASSSLASGRAGGGVWLRPGARIGVISFHSLEDRIVKRAFADLVSRGGAAPVSGGRSARPVVASDVEIARNPRARSAKLRVVRLAGAP